MSHEGDAKKAAHLENRYLARFACGWCDMPLNREGCGAIYQTCSDETRAKRRAACLENYRPRNRRNGDGV